jgi:peptide deformylase
MERKPMSEPKSKTSRGVVTDLEYLSQKSIECPPEELEGVKAALQSALAKQTDCVGLAAIQIGIPYRVAIYSLPKLGTSFLINPVITSKCGKYYVPGGEGCMSLPGLRYKVRRGSMITVRTGPADNRREFQATGFNAAVLQHEIQHMDGWTVLQAREKPVPSKESAKNRKNAKAAKAQRKRNRRK